MSPKGSRAERAGVITVKAGSRGLHNSHTRSHTTGRCRTVPEIGLKTRFRHAAFLDVEVIGGEEDVRTGDGESAVGPVVVGDGAAQWRERASVEIVETSIARGEGDLGAECGGSKEVRGVAEG